MRFRNVTDKHPRFHSRLRLPGRERCGRVSRPTPPRPPASARRSSRRCATTTRRGSTTAASARCSPARRTASSSTPQVKDAWGIPVLRFDYTFGDNEKKMAADMADTAEEMLRAAGATDIMVRRNILTEGWSIHEMGTARMGNDPKTSVTNSFGQTHDVKNLFVVDGSIFVSASCQNPDVDDHGALLARHGLRQGRDEARQPLAPACGAHRPSAMGLDIRIRIPHRHSMQHPHSARPSPTLTRHRSLGDPRRVAGDVRRNHAGRRPLGRHHRRLGRGRRHGRIPAGDGRHQGAGARSRADARLAEGVPDDGVAVRVAASPAPAARHACAERRRVQLRRPALRQPSRSSRSTRS